MAGFTCIYGFTRLAYLNEFENLSFDYWASIGGMLTNQTVTDKVFYYDIIYLDG
ncbi:MAG: hypothetical protein R2784_14300 [Saprospiraceae bacterium]